MVMLSMSAEFSRRGLFFSHTAYPRASYSLSMLAGRSEHTDCQSCSVACDDGTGTSSKECPLSSLAVCAR